MLDKVLQRPDRPQKTTPTRIVEGTINVRIGHNSNVGYTDLCAFIKVEGGEKIDLQPFERGLIEGDNNGHYDFGKNVPRNAKKSHGENYNGRETIALRYWDGKVEI
jgi:hypothetical protein